MGYVFISYSSKNQKYADATRELLLENNIPCWMAPYNIPAGHKYAGVINDALENCGCLLLLLTEDSQESEYVNREVERAISNKKSIITMQLEEIELNSDFKFYISCGQVVAVNKIDTNSPAMKKILESVSVFVNTDSDNFLSSKSTAYETSHQKVTGGLVETELEKANKYFKSWIPFHYKICFKILSKISSTNPDEFAQNTRAIKNLAYCYQNGKGTKLNLNQAFKWYKIASDKNDNVSLCEVGKCYYYAMGTEKNYELAYEYFTRADAQGSILSNLYLGYCYHYGMGVKQDYSKALSHYQKSANNGSSQAKLKLAYFALEGLASPVNYAEALKWYNEVINNSLTNDTRAKALRSKANIYSKGLGVRKNKAISFWYKTRAIFTDGIGLAVLVGNRHYGFTLSITRKK